MTNLSEIQSRVSTLLMDNSQIIWSGEILTEAIRAALEEYNLARPLTAEGSFLLEMPAQEISLDTLPGFREVLSLTYPWQAGSAAKQAPNQIRGWHSWFVGSRPFLSLRSSGTLKPGQTLRIIYLASHSLAGLDGAEVTTLPVEHNGLLVRGASGLAALSRGLDRIEQRSYGSRRAEPEQLSRWGAGQLASYRSALAALRQSLPPFPSPHWQMDRWEAREAG
jgi:hypothetical protein